MLSDNIGEVINSERIGRGWTQKYLAEKAHVSRYLVIAVEHGQAVSFEIIKSLLDALDLKIVIERKGGIKW